MIPSRSLSTSKCCQIIVKVRGPMPFHLDSIPFTHVLQIRRVVIYTLSCQIGDSNVHLCPHPFHVRSFRRRHCPKNSKRRGALVHLGRSTGRHLSQHWRVVGRLLAPFHWARQLLDASAHGHLCLRRVGRNHRALFGGTCDVRQRVQIASLPASRPVWSRERRRHRSSRCAWFI